MSTYYHYQGFVYGPWKYELPDFYDDRVSDILSLPKYKWTGPLLEDWQPLTEGKDFNLEEQFWNGVDWWPTYHLIDSKVKPGTKTRTVAIPINQ